MARGTIAEGEQPSAAAEGALTADTTFADTGNGMAAFSGEPGENGHNGHAEDAPSRKKPSNPSAVPTHSRKCRSACPDFGASTRSRKSSSAGK